MLNGILKSKLFYIFIAATSIALMVFSFYSIERSDAIVAQVESQKTAISFQKPILVKAIHVSAGQHVTKGQLLVEVERPDLVMERTKLVNEEQLILSEKNKLNSDQESKVRLLEIEMSGKIQRLQVDISQLENEIRLNQALYADVMAISTYDSSSILTSQENPDQILLNSYQQEIDRLKRYHRSELSRMEVLKFNDLRALDLRLSLLGSELAVLETEEGSQHQLAPFDGAIGNVNIQLMELVSPYQTILTVYEEQPPTIKAFVNIATQIELAVGQNVTVESASRSYLTVGKVIEVGARIVAYQDLSKPLSPVQLFGKEVFIQLPEDNAFLYGEQVYVFADVN